MGLVATTKCETEFTPQVTNSSWDESAAVEEKWCVIEGIIRFSQPLSIWNTYVGLTLLYKALPKPIFVLLWTITLFTHPWYVIWLAQFCSEKFTNGRQLWQWWCHARLGTLTSETVILYVASLFYFFLIGNLTVAFLKLIIDRVNC